MSKFTVSRIFAVLALFVALGFQPFFNARAYSWGFDFGGFFDGGEKDKNGSGKKNPEQGSYSFYRPSEMRIDLGGLASWGTNAMSSLISGSAGAVSSLVNTAATYGNQFFDTFSSQPLSAGTGNLLTPGLAAAISNPGKAVDRAGGALSLAQSFVNTAFVDPVSQGYAAAKSGFDSAFSSLFSQPSSSLSPSQSFLSSYSSGQAAYITASANSILLENGFTQNYGQENSAKIVAAADVFAGALRAGSVNGLGEIASSSGGVSFSDPQVRSLSLNNDGLSLVGNPKSSGGAAELPGEAGFAAAVSAADPVLGKAAAGLLAKLKTDPNAATDGSLTGEQQALLELVQARLDVQAAEGRCALDNTALPLPPEIARYAQLQAARNADLRIGQVPAREAGEPAVIPPAQPGQPAETIKVDGVNPALSLFQDPAESRQEPDADPGANTSTNPNFLNKPERKQKVLAPDKYKNADTADALQEAYNDPEVTLGDVAAICEEKWGPVLGKIAIPLAVLGAAEFKAIGIDPASSQAKDKVKEIYGYTGGMANVPSTVIFGLDMADPYNKNVLTGDQRVEVFKERPIELVEFGAVAVTAGGGGLIGAGARVITGESAAAMVETTVLGASKAGAVWAGVSVASDEAYSWLSGKGGAAPEELARSAREGYATGFVFGTAFEALGAFAEAKNAGEFANLVKADPGAYSWWQRQMAVSGEALGMFAKDPNALAMNSLTGAATFIGAGPVFHTGSWVVESAFDSLATGDAHFVEMKGPQGETGLPWYQDLALSSADSPKQGLWLGPATSAFGLSSLTLDSSGKGAVSVWSRNAANSGPISGTVYSLLEKDAPALTKESNWLTAGIPASPASLFNQFDNAIFYGGLNTAVQTGLVKAGFSQDDANLISQVPFFLVPRYAGGTPVKGEAQEASGKILVKVITRERAVQLGFDLPVEGTGTAKEAYLPTRELKESDLPVTPGLRQPRVISVPETTGDIPQVKVVFPDNTDIRLVSETHSGKQGQVKLGFLESGSPVVLKTYTEPSDVVIDDGRPQSALIEESLLKDYQGGKIADDLGIGPSMHGIYKDAAGKDWIVMDLVAGEVYSDSFKNKGWINENTVNDLAEVNKRLTENNRGLTGDLQFIVGSSGHIQLIDAAGLTYEVKTNKAREASDKKFAGIEQELVISASENR